MAFLIAFRKKFTILSKENILPYILLSWRNNYLPITIKLISPHHNKTQHLPALTLFLSIFSDLFWIKSSFIKRIPFPLISPSVALVLYKSSCRNFLISKHTFNFLKKVKSVTFPSQYLKKSSCKACCNILYQPYYFFYRWYSKSKIKKCNAQTHKRSLLHAIIESMFCILFLRYSFSVC